MARGTQDKAEERVSPHQGGCASRSGTQAWQPRQRSPLEVLLGVHWKIHGVGGTTLTMEELEAGVWISPARIYTGQRWPQELRKASCQIAFKTEKLTACLHADGNNTLEGDIPDREGRGGAKGTENKDGGMAIKRGGRGGLRQEDFTSHFWESRDVKIP